MGESRGDLANPRLPIRLDSTSNGEFEPVPLGAAARFANRLAHQHASRNARRLGISRRAFLVSACGAASTLLAMNRAFARAGVRGGAYDLPDEAAFEPQLAEAMLAGDEFVFDIQGHHVNPHGAWRQSAPRWTRILEGFPYADCAPGGDALACFSAQHFVREVFIESDTDMAVLSFVPEPDLDAAPLRIEEADATRAIIGPVHPNFPGELERMEVLAERWKVSAWKTYTQYGPNGRGYWLDDEKVGIPFIEKARALGVKVICVHKGFPLPNMDLEHSSCRDVGVVAKRYPDVHFIVYHSGFETQTKEESFDPRAARRGIDSLVRAVRDNGIGPDGNVYAELGSTWRFLMRDPEQAAHGIGKLLRYLGEDRVLWGTDSIWYGSPQDQIQAFRRFQIDPELRERYGYPEITGAIRAKVFGLNAALPYGIDVPAARARTAGDAVSRAEAAFRQRPDPSFLTHGPQTRADFLRFLRASGA
jgi:predicted TIM-barrel fold metal-dependent hydrolase